jgi:translation initiation factor 3 subunit J
MVSQVADNWEEEEDSEAEREKAAKAAAAKAKADAAVSAAKKSKSQRIEEHREEARRRRAAEEEEGEEEETSSEDDDPAQKRAKALQAEKDADLKNAQDLLANVGMGPKTKSAPNKALIVEDKSNPGQAIDLSTIPLFTPSTRSQFDALSTTLVPLLTASSYKPHYSLWLQDFVKKISADLPSTEIKKAASGLTALSNEKLKEEKAQDKTWKKSKAAKSKTTLAAGRDVGRGIADTTSYEDGLGDDDFM